MARATARRRSGFHGLRPTTLSARSTARKRFRTVANSRERAKARSAGVGGRSQSSGTAASAPTWAYGRCAIRSVSGTTVPRAQLDMA